MISYFLIFSSLLISLYPRMKAKINDDYIYALIFTSLSVSHLILGFISLLIINLNISKLPIIFISSLILVITIIKEGKIAYKFSNLYKFIYSEINKILEKNKKNKFQRFLLYFISLITLFIFLSSIGPINHPDAADYHVGYPYQYFLKGGFFIDGGLLQGLLGIGDYANLAFIQEKTTWLIRTVQIINLPILILFLANKIKNNIFLLGLISTPTFIQWSTIGKPLFMGDSCLIGTYIIWKCNKSGFNLKLLLILSITCISFKISSLIIVFTILVETLLYLINSKNSKRKISIDYKSILKSKLLIFVLLIFIFLLVNRHLITGNFAYPLLTNIFNKNEPLIIEFSNIVKNYGRSGTFPLNIFIPSSLGEFGQSLGPFIIFSIIFFIKKFKNFSFNNSYPNLWTITFAQLILLLLFAQGRSDYYVAPLILVSLLSNQINLTNNKNIINYIFYLSIIIQVGIISTFLSFSILQTKNSLKNYNQNMSETAFGFSSSLIIDEKKAGNILFTSRNTRLYYPHNYIDKDLLKKCIYDSGLNGESNSQNICLDKYEINQIISNRDFLKENLKFECKNIAIISGSRNPFNRKTLEKQYCNRRISSK